MLVLKRLITTAGAIAVAVLTTAPPAFADTNPCTLVLPAQAAALSGGSGVGDWHHHTGTGRYGQETCHYPGPVNRAFFVAVHLSSAPFANVKMMTKPLGGVGDDAAWMSQAGVIAFVKHGTYVSMSWAGDAGRPAPSPQFLLAAKTAASKL